MSNDFLIVTIMLSNTPVMVEAIKQNFVNCMSRKYKILDLYWFTLFIG